MLQFLENNIGVAIGILGSLCTILAALYTVYFRFNQKIQREQSDKVRLYEHITELRVKLEISATKIEDIDKRLNNSEHAVTATTVLLQAMKDEVRKGFEDMQNSIREINTNVLQFFKDRK